MSCLCNSYVCHYFKLKNFTKWSFSFWCSCVFTRNLQNIHTTKLQTVSVRGFWPHLHAHPSPLSAPTRVQVCKFAKLLISHFYKRISARNCTNSIHTKYEIKEETRVQKYVNAPVGLRRIWSRTHLVPGLPVPHFQSPCTKGPQLFGPSGQMVPIQLGPPGQTVPPKLVPLDKRSPSKSVPMDKWSPENWSPWTNGPQKIGPHGQTVPQKLVPLDKRSPKNWSLWTSGP